MLVAQALTTTVQPGNSGLLGEFRIESLTCPSKPETARPTQLTSTGRGCSHQPRHPSQEFHISSAGASRTRALTTGSSTLYQLSYGTGASTWHDHLNPIQGGGTLSPLRFFLCNCQTLRTFSSYLVTFPKYSLRTFQKKNCRVRSGQVTRAVLLTPPQKSLQSRQS